MARVQWHALQQRLYRDTKVRDGYEETIKKDLDKNYITTADPVADAWSGIFPITQ